MYYDSWELSEKYSKFMKNVEHRKYKNHFVRAFFFLQTFHICFNILLKLYKIWGYIIKKKYIL